MGEKGKLRTLEGGSVAFFCPGCQEYHEVIIDKTKSPSWDFNGNYEKPTFTPSIKVTSGHYMSGHKGSCWCDYNKTHPDNPFKCSVCHSFITDGRIQFLNDCTHELSGQIVELKDVDKI